MNYRYILVSLALFALFGITGCGRNYKGEGPMERSGKALDNAGEKVGEGVERVGEKMQGE